MLTAVVLTKNEERYIEKCLRNLTFCDQIIIVDDFSTDKTVRIARKFTTNIYKRKLSDDFSGQRNFGLEKSKGDWVLFIDSDEIVPNSLQKEIKRAIKKTDINGFYIKREDIFLGKKLKYGEVANIYLLRLGRRNSGKWERPVHEVWKIKGETGKLKNPLIHYSHTSVSELLKKINYYSSLNAKYLFQQNVRSQFISIFLYPGTKFIHNFILKLGFLDGFEGLVLSIFMSLHSFLSRSKLYLIQNAKKYQI